MTEEKQIDISELPQPPEGSVFKLVKVETLSVPHPYCITPRHVAIASDRFSGRLGVEAIEGAEKDGAGCGVKGCQLSYKQHETVKSVVIEVPQNKDLNSVPGLGAYLNENKKAFLDRGIDGFAFPTEGQQV